jgi:hypothetical protein
MKSAVEAISSGLDSRRSAGALYVHGDFLRTPIEGGGTRQLRRESGLGALRRDGGSHAT